MEDDDLKVDPVFASHNIMIKDCEKNNIIPMIVYFFPFFLSYTAILLLKAPTTYFYTNKADKCTNDTRQKSSHFLWKKTAFFVGYPKFFWPFLHRVLT